MLAQPIHTQPIVTDSIERGLDRKQLLEIQRRFLQINQVRLQRTLSALNYRQQCFLQALPILFHVNHPMLPGYTGQLTPFGLSQYKPSKDDLRLGKSYARSFRLQHSGHHTPDLHGLFLMGSLGTVAHNRRSDLDIWVCYADGLSNEQVQHLKQKCDALSETARQVALDCHFFLMNATDFRQGQSQDLSNEASGSTQHLLLLDEFYRTATWLAGRLPLWWLIPARREQHYRDYRHQLFVKRFIPEDKYIDFGAVPGIPPEEFTGAALWQLYKAIEAPYKSVFKLLLLEAYTCAFPGFQPLSLSFKQVIYDGEIDADELDPYIVAYRRIEHYLMQRKEPQRLELVRRCLYFKVNKPLSKKPQHAQASWQRLLLQRLVTEWQWSRDKIARLDQRRQWKADQVAQERQALVGELLSSYKTLMAFKQRHQADARVNPEEFTTLGYKLYANYERRPGKIEWINPGIADDLNEAHLYFVEDSGDTTQAQDAPLWRVYRHTNADVDSNINWQLACPMPLKQGSLVELILWCHCNGLLTSTTRCEFGGNDKQTSPASQSTAQIYPLIRALQQWLPLPLRQSHHDDFKQRAATTHIFIHINLAQSQQGKVQAGSMFEFASPEEIHGAGELRHDRIKSIDLVTRNSWNEIECRQFYNKNTQGPDNNALALCLRTCLQASLSPGNQCCLKPNIRIHCGRSSEGNTTRHQVETLLHDLFACYANPELPLASRYIYSAGQGYYACQCQHVSSQHIQARFEALGDNNALEDYLARQQSNHSPLVFDRFAQVDDSLRLIAKVSDSRAINIVYRKLGNLAEITLLDEQGSIFRGRVPYYNDAALLQSLHHFLRQAIRRQTALGGDFRADFDVFPVRFYKLRCKDDRRFLEACHCSTELAKLACYPVTAQLHCDRLGTDYIVLHCGHSEFNQRTLGERFYARVREQIFTQRPSRERYPCYITDLDLSHYHLPGLNPKQWQISHYLRFKVDLEARLNTEV